jgi:hypothetical protein
MVHPPPHSHFTALFFAKLMAAASQVDKLAEGNETHRVAEKMRQNGRDEMIKAANYLSFARNEQLSKCLVETLKYAAHSCLHVTCMLKPCADSGHSTS